MGRWIEIFTDVWASRLRFLSWGGCSEKTPMLTFFVSRENSNSLFEHVEFIDLNGIKMLCQLTA